MMAWMNAESLALTLERGETVFWSRSRQELWHKGATSGNTQKVVELRYDCDADTLLALVHPVGPRMPHRRHQLFLSHAGQVRVAASPSSAMLANDVWSHPTEAVENARRRNKRNERIWALAWQCSHGG